MTGSSALSGYGSGGRPCGTAAPAPGTRIPTAPDAQTTPETARNFLRLTLRVVPVLFFRGFILLEFILLPVSQIRAAQYLNPQRSNHSLPSPNDLASQFTPDSYSGKSPSECLLRCNRAAWNYVSVPMSRLRRKLCACPRMGSPGSFGLATMCLSPYRIPSIAAPLLSNADVSNLCANVPFRKPHWIERICVSGVVGDTSGLTLQSSSVFRGPTDSSWKELNY